MKKLLLTLLGAILMFPAFAFNFDYTYEGQTLRYATDYDKENGVYIPSGQGSISGSLVIPESITHEGKTYIVTKIGEAAFYGCSNLTSVTIPNSVTSIENIAFYSCSNLVSVTVPNSVTSMGDGVFEGCSGMTSAVIGNSLTTISKSTFKDCSNLSSVKIGKSVTKIEDAFIKCNSLAKIEFSSIEAMCKIQYESPYSNPLRYGLTLWVDGKEIKDLVIPESVTEIGNYAFYGCNSLSSVKIGKSVNSIGEKAFWGCTGLTKAEFPSIETLCNIKYGDEASNPLVYAQNLWVAGKEIKDLTIPESVTEIGKYVFAGCNLTSVTLPNTITSIGEGVFNYSKIASIKIPNSVTSIGDRAFANCTQLNSIEIPNSVSSIDNCAFYGCSGLTSVYIGKSVTSIGQSAFYNCNSLTKAEFASLEAMCKIIYDDYSSNPLFYAHILWIDGKEIKDLLIPETITEIKSYTFTRCSGLTSVTIPNTVTKIGNSAFSHCSGLTSLIIPSSVTSIGTDAFSTCSGLTSVTIPNSITTIGSYAFQSCSKLKSVSIGNSVTSIGRQAFKDCTNLKSVSVGRSIKSVGEQAFNGCGELKRAAYPQTYSNLLKCEYIVTYDPTEASVDNGYVLSDRGSTVIFAPYVPDGKYELPKTVSIIGSEVFNNLDNLVSIVIPDNVTTISDKAFVGCENLKDITLPLLLESLGSAVFEGCTGITDVVFRGPTPVEGSSDVFESTIYEDARLYVRSGRKALFTVVSPWKFFYNITEDTFVKLTLDKTEAELTEEETLQLSATVTPASDEKIEWTSSDTSVATVSETGLVTAVSEGTATITAKCGESTATCTIIVSAKSGIYVIGADAAEVDVYNLAGIMMLHNAKLADLRTLAPGAYIVRQGNVVKKIAVM